MEIEYKVVDDFYARHIHIITADRKIDIRDLSKGYFYVDGEKINYGLTHNEHFLTVDTEKNLLGKTIVLERV